MIIILLLLFIAEQFTIIHDSLVVYLVLCESILNVWMVKKKKTLTLNLQYVNAKILIYIEHNLPNIEKKVLSVI